MSIVEKLHLPRPSWWKLNAIYLFNLTLVLLFLILPAITGPGSKIWWMTITYTSPGAVGEAGGSDWKMGGFGVCKSGEECSGTGSSMAPAIAGQIKSVLIYHLAAAAMVLVIAVVELLMIPRQGGSVCKGWATFCLPLFGALIVVSVMAVDLIIRATLQKNKSIGEVRTEPVFWLSVSAVFSVIFWTISAIQLRQIKYDKTSDELQKAEAQEKAERRRARAEAKNDKSVLHWLWPWSR